MQLMIDTDKIADAEPVLKALGFQRTPERRFFRGLPPPYGRGVDITHLMTFTDDGAPIFPRSNADDTNAPMSAALSDMSRRAYRNTYRPRARKEKS